MSEFIRENGSGVPTGPLECTASQDVSANQRRIATNFSWLMVGEIAGKGLVFITTIYLARVLGSAGFGKLSFATAFVTYAALLSDFGLSKYGTREAARNPGEIENCIINIQSTKLVLSSFLFLVACLLTWLLLDDYEMRLLFIFSFIWLFPYALGLDWVFRGLERMRYSALWNFLQQAVFLALILLLATKANDLTRVPVCKAIGCLVASGFLVLSLSRIVNPRVLIPRFNVKAFKRVLIAGAPLAASYLMVQVYWNVDTIILGIVDKPEIVGIYNAAYKVVLLAACACYTVTNAFYPRLSYDFIHDYPNFRRNLIRMLRIVIIGGFVVSAAVFALRKPMVLLLYGSAYAEAAVALSILSFAILGDYIVSSLGTAYISAGYERLAFVAVMLGAVTNISLNIILIPRFSFIGAAISTISSYTVIATYFLVNLRVVLKGERHAAV